MKNYFNTRLDLENKKDRVEVLEHNIEKANSQLFKITSTLKDTVTNGGKREKDKMAKILGDIQKWQDELMDLKEDILYLTPYVEKMEKRVNAMVGAEKEVFEGFYNTYANKKTGERIRILANKLNYSSPRIYQILNKVNNDLGIKVNKESENKHYKKL